MQWAIINGEIETGVTLHYIDEGIDTGPVIAQARFPIEWKDYAMSIQQKLKVAGVRLITDYWPDIAAGTVTRLPQDNSKARYYRLRTTDDGRIDWSSSNVTIYNLVRSLVSPWPGAFTFLHRQKLVLRKVTPVDSLEGKDRPGLI